MKNVYRIPPNWIKLILSFIALILALLLRYYGIDASIPRLSVKSLVWITLISVILSSARYELYEDYCITYLAFIPVRRIFWKDVGSAVYYPGKENDAMRNPYILLVRNAAQQEKLTHEKSTHNLHLKRFCSVRIMLPYKDEVQHISAIESRLGFPVTPIK